jgi:hypothetical protein
MQTSTRTEDRSTFRHVSAIARLMNPGCALTQHEPGRKLGVVDGLVSVTQRAWGLAVEGVNWNTAPVVAQ